MPVQIDKCTLHTTNGLVELQRELLFGNEGLLRCEIDSFYVNTNCCDSVYVVGPDCKIYGHVIEKNGVQVQRVKISKEVDPTDNRIGTVLNKEKYRWLIQWDANVRRWEYAANLDIYIKPVEVNGRVEVSGFYTTGRGGPFEQPLVNHRIAKVVYLHGDYAAVIWENSNMLALVRRDSLKAID